MSSVSPVAPMPRAWLLNEINSVPILPDESLGRADGPDVAV